MKVSVSDHRKDEPMQYLLSMYYQEAQDAGISEEDMAPAMAAFDKYAKDLTEAGVLISTNVLQPVVTATTITMRNGSLEVQDGPFADTKEKLGGVFLLELPDLDAALAWAEKNPAATWGSIEIRPTALTYRDGAWQGSL